MNWIFTEHHVREHQQAMLDEAQNQHLVELETPSFRVRLAHWLRDTANKLEPICSDATQTLVSSK